MINSYFLFASRDSEPSLSVEHLFQGTRTHPTTLYQIPCIMKSAGHQHNSVITSEVGRHSSREVVCSLLATSEGLPDMNRSCQRKLKCLPVHQGDILRPSTCRRSICRYQWASHPWIWVRRAHCTFCDLFSITYLIMYCNY